MIRKLILAALGAAAVHLVGAPHVVAHARNLVDRHSAEASGQAAVVERVLDGDTVILKGSRDRVRLANIDAPEMSHGYGRPGQPFAAQAMKWMERKVEGKRVALTCPDEDRYGRRVCVLYLDGEDVNRSLVRAGLAWANTAHPRYLRDKTVLDAQRDAQAAHLGIWSQARPTPPWEWRRQCWEKASCEAAPH